MQSLAPQRIFLGWTPPLADAVAQHLLGQVASTLPHDLGAHLVLVPSQGIAQLIRESLARLAPHGVLLPRFQTPTEFLDLGSVPHVCATPSEVLVSWIDVLAPAQRAHLPHLFPKSDGGPLGFDAARRLAATLIQLRDELANSGQGHDFARVAGHAQNREPGRWAELAALEGQYRAALTQRGKRDHNDERVQFAHETRLASGIAHIWLAGLPAPPPLLLTALQKRMKLLPISVLIGADLSDADDFDAWGQPQGATWLSRRSEWPDFDARVHVVRSRLDGLGVLRRLLGDGQPEPDVHAICACNREADAPRLAALVRDMGALADDPLGTPFASHWLHQALRQWGQMLADEEPGIDLLRALLLVPQWRAGLTAPDGAQTHRPPGGLDPRVLFTHLHLGLDAADSAMLRGALSQVLARIHDRPMPEGGRAQEEHAHLQTLAGVITHVIALRDADRRVAWLDALLTTLTYLLQRMRFRDDVVADQFTLAVADALVQAAQEVQSAHAEQAAPRSHEEAFALVAELTATQRFRPAVGATDVRLPGWVEAPWEPAPHLVLFGFNDDVLPTTVHAHPFLPASLRDAVGLPSNEAIVSAAAFQFEQLWRRRLNGGRFDVIVLQQNAEGDPVRPSRLLFTGPDAVLPQRVKHLLKASPLLGGQPFWQIPLEHRFQPLAEATDAQKVRSAISATKFKEFLQNPAEFWLKSALGLDTIEFSRLELNAAGFGTLVHGALERFGRANLRELTTDQGEIERQVLDHLAAYVAETFGTRPDKAIQLQVQAAGRRLAAFSHAQAALALEGWAIAEVEGWLPALEVNGMRINGRYDRLDQNVRTGEWRVYDYKTFAEAKAPQTTHLRNPRDGEQEFLVEVPKASGGTSMKRWRDLQLPVYHWALQEGHAAIGSSPLSVAYFCLAADGADHPLDACQVWSGFASIAEASRDTIRAITALLRTGGADVFAPSDRGSDYPLLPALADRPMAAYLDVAALGGVRC